MEINELSNKIFGKDHDKLKYIMLTNFVHSSLLEGEQCLRTGLYSWLPVFDGEISHFKKVDLEDLKKYDIVHINLSGQDIHTVGEIREALGKNSKTKLVVNNDYTVELWASAFDYLPMIAREINHADVIFGTEPNQVGTLEVLTGRKVHLIVHPCFVKRLKTLTPKRRLDVISVVSHRYDNYNIVPSLAVEKLGLKTRLIGYDESTDPKQFITQTRYNSILSGTNYMDFCDILMESKIVVDPFTLTSQNRTGWDCAALGVPLVVSERTYSGQVCFPQTCIPPHNIKLMREKIKRLLTDDKFREEVISYAKKAVEDVSYENSKLKFLKALDEGSPKIEI